MQHGGDNDKDQHFIFFLFFTANCEWTGNKIPTPYGLCTLTFHLLSSRCGTAISFLISKFLYKKTWNIFVLSLYCIKFSYDINDQYYFVEIYKKGLKNHFIANFFCFWLMVEHIVTSNCLNKINSKNRTK